MFKSFTLIELLTGVFVVLILTIMLLSWPIQSYFEAKAYNNVTGKNISTWDAMFLELRVTNE